MINYSKLFFDRGCPFFDDEGKKVNQAPIQPELLNYLPIFRRLFEIS